MYQVVQPTQGHTEMARESNPKLEVGDLLLDTGTRVTLRVSRLIGNSRVEVVELTPMAEPRIVDSSYYVRGIVSGSVRRI